MGRSGFMETTHLYDFSSQRQYNIKATSTHMVSHGQFFLYYDSFVLAIQDLVLLYVNVGI